MPERSEKAEQTGRERLPYDPEDWNRRLAEARAKRAAALSRRDRSGADQKLAVAARQMGSRRPEDLSTNPAGKDAGADPAALDDASSDAVPLTSRPWMTPAMTLLAGCFIGATISAIALAVWQAESPAPDAGAQVALASAPAAGTPTAAPVDKQASPLRPSAPRDQSATMPARAALGDLPVHTAAAHIPAEAETVYVPVDTPGTTPLAVVTLPNFAALAAAAGGTRAAEIPAATTLANTPLHLALTDTPTADEPADDAIATVDLAREDVRAETPVTAVPADVQVADAAADTPTEGATTGALAANIPDAAFHPFGRLPVAEDAPSAGAALKRIIVLAPKSVSRSSRDQIAAVLIEAGWPAKNPATSPFTISRTHVRYYHPADRKAADELGALLSAEARDFTGASPRPPSGVVELWLAGRAPVVKPKRTQPTIAGVFSRIASILEGRG